MGPLGALQSTHREGGGGLPAAGRHAATRRRGALHCLISISAPVPAAAAAARSGPAVKLDLLPEQHH